MSFNSDLLDLCKLNQLNEVCNNNVDQQAIDLKMSHVASKVINAPTDTAEALKPSYNKAIMPCATCSNQHSYRCNTCKCNERLAINYRPRTAQ